MAGAMSELRDLLDRAERDGMTKGLAYRIARASRGDDYLVCVRCGWPWAGMNRCVNRDCLAFCAWGDGQGLPPTSWLPTGPRPIGCTTEEWRQAWQIARSSS